jgi:hemolysin III
LLIESTWSVSTANACDEANRHNPAMEQRLVPRLRGVFHLYAFVAAVVAGTVLVALADGYLERFAVWVYAVALAAMFGASALYHRFPWRSATARLRARRLDHAMIFVFIAGTYTAFALVAFTGAARIVGLATVWAGAAFGIFLNLVWIDAPRWLSAVAYLGVGWVGLILIPQLFPALGVAAAVLVIVGGALYSVGALTYASAWPNPFPATFGFHEIFHVLVIAAAVTQFVALSLVVL